MTDTDSNTDTDTDTAPDPTAELGAIGETIERAIDARFNKFETRLDDALEDTVTHRQLMNSVPSEEELACDCPNKDVHMDPNAYLRVDDAPELIKGVVEDVGGTTSTAAIVDAMARGNPDVAEYLFPARKIGLDMPDGEYHEATRWGIHFETKTGFHIGHATVDAKEDTTFTAVLGEYNGGDRFHPVDETELTVTAGESRVELDLHAPEGGEYLLTRYGSAPLKRADYEDIEQDEFTDGLRIIGGSKPGDYVKPSPFWYYYFDLEIAAHEDAHPDDHDYG